MKNFDVEIKKIQDQIHGLLSKIDNLEKEKANAEKKTEGTYHVAALVRKAYGTNSAEHKEAKALCQFAINHGYKGYNGQTTKRNSKKTTQTEMELK